MFTDYYQVLKIDRKATEEEIRKAYREMAKLYHPDQNDSPAAHKRFIEIKEAYETLINPQSRSKFNSLYDRQHNGGKSSYVHVRSRSGGGGSGYGRAKHRGRRYNRRPSTSRYDNGREPVRRERPAYMGPEYDFSAGSTLERQAEVLGSRIGYTYFSWFARIAAACTLLLSLVLIADFFFASRTPDQPIIHTHELPWSLAEPGIVQVQTATATFMVHRSYWEYVREGRNIRLSITPIGKYVTRVYATGWDGKERSFRPFGGLYGATFFLVLILMGLSLTTLILRKNAELASYVGTINLLLFVIIFSIIKNA